MGPLALLFCGPIGIIIFIIFCASKYYSGKKRDKERSIVAGVKGALLKAYPNKTLEQMVCNYFNNPKWKTFIGDDRNRYVNIEGRILYDRKKVNALLQYKYYRNNTFDFNSFVINGVPQNVTVYKKLMDEIYSKIQLG